MYVCNKLLLSFIGLILDICKWRIPSHLTFIFIFTLSCLELAILGGRLDGRGLMENTFRFIDQKGRFKVDVVGFYGVSLVELVAFLHCSFF
jgi:hypothetical protein